LKPLPPMHTRRQLLLPIAPCPVPSSPSPSLTQTHTPVDSCCCVTSLPDGPHHQALTAPAVASSKHARDGGGKLAPLGLWWWQQQQQGAGGISRGRGRQHQGQQRQDHENRTPRGGYVLGNCKVLTGAAATFHTHHKLCGFSRPCALPGSCCVHLCRCPAPVPVLPQGPGSPWPAAPCRSQAHALSRAAPQACHPQTCEGGVGVWWWWWGGVRGRSEEHCVNSTVAGRRGSWQKRIVLCVGWRKSSNGVAGVQQKIL
jgi:hypothetical protein